MNPNKQKPLTAEDLFLQKYGNQITERDSWVIRFANDLASLQLSEAKREIDELKLELSGNDLSMGAMLNQINSLQSELDEVKKERDELLSKIPTNNLTKQ